MYKLVLGIAYLTRESAALIQVLMQVEEEEGGKVGMMGVWENDGGVKDPGGLGYYNLFDDRNSDPGVGGGGVMKR